MNKMGLPLITTEISNQVDAWVGLKDLMASDLAQLNIIADD